MNKALYKILEAIKNFNVGSHYIFPIWAEENSALTTGFVFSFGNGTSGNSSNGVVVPVPAGWKYEITSLSLHISAGTATVQVSKNGSSLGSSAEISISSGTDKTVQLSPPIEISDCDVLNFYCSSASSGSAGNVATLFILATKLTT